MSEKRSVTCDHCGKELVVDSSYPANYGLHLCCKNYGLNSTGIQYAVCMHPPLREGKDFCGWKCLEGWLSKRTSYAPLDQ